MALEIPVLNPAGVAEVLEFGLLGYALSRFSGSWVGMIALTDAMDSTETVLVGSRRVRASCCRRASRRRDGASASVDTRATRSGACARSVPPPPLAFARANGLNPIVLDSPNARLGIVATGKAWLDLRQALADLGISDEVARDLGLRLWKVGMSWPLEPEATREFADGLEQILVVEEKRPLIETRSGEQLYGAGRVRRASSASATRRAALLLPRHVRAGRGADRAGDRRAALADGCPTERGHEYLAELEARSPRPARRTRAESARRSSARAVRTTRRRSCPRAAAAWRGSAATTWCSWMDRSTDTYTQMGGEGVPWIGQAPFTDEEHVFVNLGDGTYFHSGILAIRAAQSPRASTSPTRSCSTARSR